MLPSYVHVLCRSSRLTIIRLSAAMISSPRYQPDNRKLFYRYYSTDDPQKKVDYGKISAEEWKKKLSPEQYVVCRQSGTEPAFSGQYYTHKGVGTYNCACCGVTLFSSDTKYDSGSGWPSFYEPHKDQAGSNVVEKPDSSAGVLRTEVVCKQCRAHLGHVFPDGPDPTGLRYCINSLSLKFNEKKK